MNEQLITTTEQKDRYILLEKCKEFLIKKNSLKIKYLEELNNELDLLSLKIINLNNSLLSATDKKKVIEQFSDHPSDIYLAISKILRA